MMRKVLVSGVVLFLWMVPHVHADVQAGDRAAPMFERAADQFWGEDHREPQLRFYDRYDGVYAWTHKHGSVIRVFRPLWRKHSLAFRCHVWLHEEGHTRGFEHGQGRTRAQRWLMAGFYRGPSGWCVRWARSLQSG